MTTKQLSVLIAHDSMMPGEWIAEHLPAEDGITIKEILSSLSSDSDILRSSDADLLIVGCAEQSEEALDLIEWWVEHRHGRPVLVLCQNSPNGFVQRAFAAGADDLVVLEPGPGIAPESLRQVNFALQKAIARRAKPGTVETAHGAVICVLGPKGGIGKTVASCNLSVALAMKRKRVVVIDLDLQFGDVALILGLRPETTIYDLSVSGGSLDADKIEAFMTVHPSGLRVLAAPVRPDQADVITPEYVGELITALRNTYDYIVIDTPPSFSPEVIAAVDVSSYICMVGMLDAPSLKNTRLGLETLDLMGYPSDRIRVVLNRANTSVGITGDDVVSILGRTPDILVPSTRDVTRSVNQGDPIVLSQKRSEAARSFATLAELFTQQVVIRPRRRRNRLTLGRNKG